MATSSIHIASGAGGYFAHNSREQETVNSIFKDEPNFCSCSKDEAFKIYKTELETRTQAYLSNHPTRKKLHAKTATHLSAIVNFNKEHTPQDIKRVCDYLEERFDTKVIQYSMHRDEGWEDNGVPVKNYHAHIEFMGLDSKGNSIKRQLKRKELIELQTTVANLLGMKRGTNYTAEQKPRPKRLDTHEYKAKAKAVHEAKQEYNFREMQKRITTLEHLTTEQKKDLHRLNSQVKNKKATIEELEQKILGLGSAINGLESKNKHLEEELRLETIKIDSRANMSVLEQEAEEFLYKELSVKHKSDKFSIAGAFKYLVKKVKELKDKVSELVTENKRLSTQNEMLRATIDAYDEVEEKTVETPKFTETKETKSEIGKSRRYKN